MPAPLFPRHPMSTLASMTLYRVNRGTLCELNDKGRWEVEVKRGDAAGHQPRKQAVRQRVQRHVGMNSYG